RRGRMTDDALALARRLMDALGRDLLGEPLQARGWTVGLDRARRRLGACHLSARRITLSAHLLPSLPPDEVEDTIRHEIAHAIDGERRGRTNHDGAWKAVARACGARPERTFRGDLPDDSAEAPYSAVCPTCGATSGLHRQPVHPRRCRACHAAKQPAYLTVRHSASGKTIWPGGATPGVFGGWVGVTATCPGCGETVRRARRPRRATACGACCQRHAGGCYDSRFRLRFERAG
ncbi:MAG: SprT-like domain-containing protein, partial [Pseudomonadota bacterium]